MNAARTKRGARAGKPAAKSKSKAAAGKRPGARRVTAKHKSAKRKAAKRVAGKRPASKRSVPKRSVPKRAAPKRAAPKPAAPKSPAPKATVSKATAPAAPEAHAAVSAPAAAPAAPAAAKLSIGQPVPDFALPASGGSTWQLRDARARKLVLYFYPRDNTPGCTLEGQQFAALAARFDQAGTTIVGVSRDSVASHDRFCAQMKFPFLLLSDADGLACALFDVIKEKNMYGRTVMGIERSTFLLDADGVLRHEWRKVKVEGHALAVLEAAQAL
jgi:peroxiredoxin Q/BCP